MRHKRFAACILILAMILSLTACSVTDSDSYKTPAGQTVTVTDLIGRQNDIVPGSYKRVVCIGAGALRMYSYIGDMSLLCGVEDIDNTSLKDRPKMFDLVARPYVMAYADIFSQLPSCGAGGPNAQAAEAEKILSCRPDIIISEYQDADKENALQEQTGVPVITLKSSVNGVFADEFRESLELLGDIFDRKDRALQLTEYIDGQRNEIYERTASVDDADKPSVYICGLGNWGTTDHLMTAQDFTAFKVANIKNVITDIGKNGAHKIEEEKFVAIGESTDIMIIDAAAVKNIKPLYAQDKTMFDSCRAWREGEVYLQMAYNAYYTNYEIVLINTWYAAKIVYPEIFSDTDINEKADEITEMFLGRGMADEIYSYPGSYGGYQKIDTAVFFEG